MNGWKNYETWAVVNWGYDELDENMVAEVLHNDDTSEDEKVDQIVEMLRAQFYESAEYRGYTLKNGLFSELFESVINRIDWEEIAEHIIADAQ